MSAYRARLLLPVLFLTSIATACDDDGVAPEEVVRDFWVGTYVANDQVDHGTFVLDMARKGSDVIGEIVFRSREDVRRYSRLLLRGRLEGDRLHLELDRFEVDYQFTFTLQADAPTGDRLEGTFTHSPDQLTASFDGRRVEFGELAVESTAVTRQSVLGLAFDDSLLWISTSLDDYLLMNVGGEIVDSVVVYYDGDLHWTSDALTWDGTRLYGHLRVSRDSASVTLRWSRVMAFDKQGVITDTFSIPHRTQGMASDGTSVWSVARELDRLVRFDHRGNVLDSVPVGLPDLTDLEFDGDRFWVLGYFMRRLYELDRNGDVLRVYDLPINPEFATPAAIAHDGARLWFAENTSVSGARLYSLRVEN